MTEEKPKCEHGYECCMLCGHGVEAPEVAKWWGAQLAEARAALERMTSSASRIAVDLFQAQRERDKARKEKHSAVIEMAKARRQAQEAQGAADTDRMIGACTADGFVAGSLVKRLYDMTKALERELSRAILRHARCVETSDSAHAALSQAQRRIEELTGAVESLRKTHVNSTRLTDELRARIANLEAKLHEVRNASGNLIESMRVSGTQTMPTVDRALRDLKSELFPAMGADSPIPAVAQRKCDDQCILAYGHAGACNLPIATSPSPQVAQASAEGWSPKRRVELFGQDDHLQVARDANDAGRHEVAIDEILAFLRTLRRLTESAPTPSEDDPDFTRRVASVVEELLAAASESAMAGCYDNARLCIDLIRQAAKEMTRGE